MKAAYKESEPSAHKLTIGHADIPAVNEKALKFNIPESHKMFHDLQTYYEQKDIENLGTLLQNDLSAYFKKEGSVLYYFMKKNKIFDILVDMLKADVYFFDVFEIIDSVIAFNPTSTDIFFNDKNMLQDLLYTILTCYTEPESQTNTGVIDTCANILFNMARLKKHLNVLYNNGFLEVIVKALKKSLFLSDNINRDKRFLYVLNRLLLNPTTNAINNQNDYTPILQIYLEIISLPRIELCSLIFELLSKLVNRDIKVFAILFNFNFYPALVSILNNNNINIIPINEANNTNNTNYFYPKLINFLHESLTTENYDEMTKIVADNINVENLTNILLFYMNENKKINNFDINLMQSIVNLIADIIAIEYQIYEFFVFDKIYFYISENGNFQLKKSFSILLLNYLQVLPTNQLFDFLGQNEFLNEFFRDLEGCTPEMMESAVDAISEICAKISAFSQNEEKFPVILIQKLFPHFLSAIIERKENDGICLEAQNIMNSHYHDYVDDN